MAHWYPVARETDGRVPHRWYFGWALYVNRLGYRGIASKVVPALLVLVAGGLFFSKVLLGVAALIATSGLALLSWSVLGHWLIYGRPGLLILRRALALAATTKTSDIADLHVGAWRITWGLADVLPESTIHSVDAWWGSTEGEAAVEAARSLDRGPTAHPRVIVHRANEFTVPLADKSCDVVVFGLGFHEIPSAGRHRLLAEALRIVRPGGRVVLAEHAKSLNGYLMFGPGAAHWEDRSAWGAWLGSRLTNVRSERLWFGIDVFAGDAPL